jgi:hypothetical protein
MTTRQLACAVVAVWLACIAAPASAEDANGATHADWNGVWFTEQGAGTQISGFLAADDARRASQLPLIDLTAPWTEEARARFRERLSQAAISKSEGWGYPMMMMSLTPLEFVVNPAQVLILTIYRDVRRVATDGRPLSPPEDRWATAWGESVGHWEGDTLVIETVAVRQPNLFFRAPPFSEAARYTERLRKLGPDRIEGEMTSDDPATLTAPWTVRQAYVRAEGLDHLVMDTFSNDRTIEEDGVFAILPPEDER